MSTSSFLKNPPGLRHRVMMSAGLGRFEGFAPTNSQYTGASDFGIFDGEDEKVDNFIKFEKSFFSYMF